jgi:hypothetical protein
VFGSVALNIRTYVDPQNPNRVGLFKEVADMDAFQAVMENDHPGPDDAVVGRTLRTACRS